jgi:hypothetical protein
MAQTSCQEARHQQGIRSRTSPRSPVGAGEFAQSRDRENHDGGREKDFLDTSDARSLPRAVLFFHQFAGIFPKSSPF